MTKLQRYLESWQGNLVMCLLSLLISYGYFSMALDTAKTLDYLVGVLFLVWAVRSLIRTIKLVRTHGK